MVSEPEPPIPLLGLNTDEGEMRSTNRLNSERNFFSSIIHRYKVPIIYTLSGVLVFILISIGITFTSNKTYSTDCQLHKCHKTDLLTGGPVCVTETCNSSAKFIRYSINHTVNPCENFYDYICGNSDIQQYSVFNAFESLTSLIDKIPNDSPEYMKKLKRFHQSCVDYKGINEEVRKIIDDIYPWPILNKNGPKNDLDFDWINITHKLFKQGFRANFLFDVVIDFDKNNHTQKILRLSKTNFKRYNHILQIDVDEDSNNFKKTLIKLFQQIGAEDDIENDVNDIIDFKTKIANITNIKNFNIMTIEQLEARYPKLKLLDYINGIFLPYGQLNASEHVYVAMPFMDDFYNFITNPKLSNRTLANVLLWRAVNSIEEMEPSTMHGNKTEYQRQMSCTYLMYDFYMMHAASALYVRNHNIDSSIEVAMNMTLAMRDKFIDVIRRNDWLTEEMKDKMEKKISKINLLVGYPKELRNDTILENFYRDLEISSDNFIINALSYGKFGLRKKGENLRVANNETHWAGNFAHILETNAKYYVQNSIHVPVQFIQPLLADSTVPSYMNYASLGCIIGHELTHALTTQTLYYDENGNFNTTWWDINNLKIYENKISCIIDKYNNYTHPVFKNLRVNGTLTLEENVADITGIKIAYDAYLDFMSTKPSDAALVGLESYTPSQMFWMMFGSSWCSDEPYEEFSEQIKINPHAPERFRVNGALSGLKEFSRDFTCKATDAMNPANKCPLWF